MVLETLDVGCGFDPRGDVNVDSFPKETIHRTEYERIEVKNISNFVLANGCYLPFKSESFRQVYSSHTIEHVHMPVLFLRELLRVAKISSDGRKKLRVILKCPHRYGRYGLRLRQAKGHTNFFTVKWFHETLKNHDHRIQLKMGFLPHKLIPVIRWPHEITVKVYK